MGKDRKKVVIIAITIAIILIVLMVGTILFFTTDFLKSDQELFLKYLVQNVEIVEKYLEDPNKSAMEQMKSAPHIINSNIGFDLVSSNSEIANQTTPPRNFSITYTKNVDPQNNRDFSEAKMKYLTKDLFTAQYAHDGDLHVVNGINAITSVPVFNIYLGIENKNLKQLAQKLGIQDVSNIPNKIEPISLTDLLTLSEQEKEYIQNLLVKVIHTQVSKDKYEHHKNITIEIDKKQIKTNSYGMTLTSEEYKNLVVTILNEISQDETILNMLLQKIMLIDSQTETTTNTIRQYIQNQITQINTKGFQNGIKLQVYEKDGKLVRTQIEKNSTDYYIIDHERGNNSIRTLISLNYVYPKNQPETEEQPTNNSNISADDNYPIIEGSASERPQVSQQEEAVITTIKNIEFAKEISGSQSNMIAIVTYEQGEHIMKLSLQNKTEPNTLQDGFMNNIIININDSYTTYFTIKANSNLVPSSSVSVQELNENNSAVLNNRTPENIAQLLNATKAQLKKIYEQQMQVAKEVQEQENTQSGLTSDNSNAAEANTIINRTDAAGE